MTAMMMTMLLLAMLGIGVTIGFLDTDSLDKKLKSIILVWTMLQFSFFVLRIKKSI